MSAAVLGACRRCGSGVGLHRPAIEHEIGDCTDERAEREAAIAAAYRPLVLPPLDMTPRRALPPDLPAGAGDDLRFRARQEWEEEMRAAAEEGR